MIPSLIYCSVIYNELVTHNLTEKKITNYIESNPITNIPVTEDKSDGWIGKIGLCADEEEEIRVVLYRNLGGKGRDEKRGGIG